MLLDFFRSLDFWHISASFWFLICIIDPLGNMPVTISMEKSGTVVHPFRVCLYSLLILLVFFLGGDFVIRLFGIRIEYFAIAGGFVIFLMALEMLLDIVFFKSPDFGSSGDLVPLAFPMYAGPGTFTALISMTTQYSIANLLVTLVLCIIVLYIILKGTHWISQYLNVVSLYVVRKFFGIIVLAIAVQLIFDNILQIFHSPVSNQTPTEQTQLLDDEDVNRCDPLSNKTYCPSCWF